MTNSPTLSHTKSAPSSPAGVADASVLTQAPAGDLAPLGRQRLSNRRQHLVERFDHRGAKYMVGIGPTPAGERIGEIFMDGPKEGSDLHCFAQDASILASMLLQHGYTIEELRQRISRGGALFQAMRVACKLVEAPL